MLQDIKELAIFLFAHQDDETAVFQTILDELNMNRQVLCLFFTTGMKKESNASQRNNESISVLTKLGVEREDIYFIGDELCISDGDLINSMPQVANWFEHDLLKKDHVVRMYVPAWEGGHPDHDALHAISVVIGQKFQRLSLMRQYSLYNGYRCSGPIFRTFMPLPENGPVEKTKVTWRNRFRFLRFCLQYPSQRMTWIGLFPMMLTHYMIWGTQNLQPVSRKRITAPPHQGALYYERRKFSTYSLVREKISALIRRIEE